MTAWLLTMAGELNPSPRFRWLIRQVATIRDTGQKAAYSSHRSAPERPRSFGFQWCLSSGNGRWVVAGALAAAGRLVAGGAAR